LKSLAELFPHAHPTVKTVILSVAPLFFVHLYRTKTISVGRVCYHFCYHFEEGGCAGLLMNWGPALCDDLVAAARSPRSQSGSLKSVLSFPCPGGIPLQKIQSWHASVFSSPTMRFVKREAKAITGMALSHGKASQDALAEKSDESRVFSPAPSF
jgi:hypothetical protein